MEAPDNNKAKIICAIFVFICSILFFWCAHWQIGLYNDLKNNCTSEIIGVVTGVTTAQLSIRDPIAAKYLVNNSKQTKIYIEIEPDDTFKRELIYANLSNNERVGSEVLIHYSPDDPDKYYLNDWIFGCKVAGIAALLAGVGTLLTVVFLIKLVVSSKNKADTNTEEYFEEEKIN